MELPFRSKIVAAFVVRPCIVGEAKLIGVSGSFLRSADVGDRPNALHHHRSVAAAELCILIGSLVACNLFIYQRIVAGRSL